MHLVTTGAIYRADDILFGTLFSELCNKPEDVLPAYVSSNDISLNVNLVIDLLAETTWRALSRSWRRDWHNLVAQ